MRYERGFSLLEVIAAMLLLAIAFGALMQVSGGSLRATSLVRHRDQAAMWADGKMEALGRTEPLVEGKRSGRFDDTFAWTMQVVPVADGRPELRLYQVDLDVQWNETAGRAHLGFTTMKLDRPTAVARDAGSSG